MQRGAGRAWLLRGRCPAQLLIELFASDTKSDGIISTVVLLFSAFQHGRGRPCLAYGGAWLTRAACLGRASRVLLSCRRPSEPRVAASRAEADRSSARP